MSLAAETRAAVREEPFLYDSLRAGVLNYTAAAEFLDLDGDRAAVVAALRRFAEELPPLSRETADVRVRMESGVGPTGDPTDTLVSVGGVSLGPDAGANTAVLAAGAVDAPALARALGRLSIAGVEVVAAGVAGDSLAVVVDRRDGPTAVRVVEESLSTVTR